MMLPATITAVEHPGTDPPAENFIPVEDRAMPTPDDPGDLANDNLVDLTSLVEHPGTNPAPGQHLFPESTIRTDWILEVDQCPSVHNQAARRGG